MDIEAVREFFKDQAKHGVHSEHEVVRAIRKGLLSQEERQWMFDHDVTVEDMLNGRVENDPPEVHAMFVRWNEVLGFKAFYG
jgi:hypothetical protein